MKKYFFVVIAVLGMMLTSCNSLKQGSYTNVATDLRPQLQVGEMITTTVHFKKMGNWVWAADFDLKKSVRESFSNTSSNPQLSSLNRVMGSVVYHALQGTNYDVLVGPVYQIQRDGVKYTITVKGYGANYVGIK